MTSYECTYTIRWRQRENKSNRFRHAHASWNERSLFADFARAAVTMRTAIFMEVPYFDLMGCGVKPQEDYRSRGRLRRSIGDHLDSTILLLLLRLLGGGLAGCVDDVGFRTSTQQLDDDIHTS